MIVSAVPTPSLGSTPRLIDIKTGLSFDEPSRDKCCSHRERIESKPGLGSFAKPDRMKFVRVFVHPRALNPEFGGEGGSVDQTMSRRLVRIVGNRFGNTARERLDMEVIGSRSGRSHRAGLLSVGLGHL